jgi:hypothetical protein
MKTMLDKKVRDDLIIRIQMLSEASRAQWGKMNVYQMLKHCALAEEMYLGKKKYKRKFLGYLLGQYALRSILNSEAPLGRNAPTGADFIVKEIVGDISSEKHRWISLIDEYEKYSQPGIVHWFFGPMTKEQVGQFSYKHADHHLRQFGV